MQKKIAHVIIGLNVGGAELMLQRLILNSSKKEQFEHYVISLTDLGIIGPKLQEQGIEVYSLGITSLRSLPSTVLKLRRLIKKIDPDVVQTWMYHADLLGGLAAKSLGVKKIIWGIRNTELNTSSSVSRQAIVKLCSKLSYYIPNDIVCVANTSMRTHVKQGGYDPSKMIVVPNGFDTIRFKPDEPQRNTLRDKLNINPDELVIGNIGRFDPVKNHASFIKACIKLLEDGFKFKVLLAGRDVDLKNPTISKLFKGTSLQEYFIFLGEITDTPSFYNAIDIFCLCSTTEGFPNVLGEAMACAKVCLTTDAGDAWLILADNGFRINSTRSSDIATALESKVLNNTINYLNDIGNSARKSIIENYAIDTIISKFEDLY